MQLQKVLESEVHETIRIEEFRSFIEKVFGGLSDEILRDIKSGEEVSKDKRNRIKERLESTEDLLLKSINSIISQVRCFYHILLFYEMFS